VPRVEGIVPDLLAGFDLSAGEKCGGYAILSPPSVEAVADEDQLVAHLEVFLSRKGRAAGFIRLGALS
jgi:hypothetical protein